VRFRAEQPNKRRQLRVESASGSPRAQDEQRGVLKSVAQVYHVQTACVNGLPGALTTAQ
jgi:hypothetical protein